jgi:DNA-binding XRE family transcriptional regulator
MESFSGLLLRHRGRTGLTQRELADRIDASVRTVENWEGGVNYPNAKPLQALIAALLESGGLTVGQELNEARELWAAVLRHAPRMTTLRRCSSQVIARVATETALPGTAQCCKLLARPDIRAAWW